MDYIDLSAALNIVNVKLLLKRLKIIGLSDDLIKLVVKWPSIRYYYVSVDRA